MPRHIDREKVELIKDILRKIRDKEISASLSGIEYYWGTREFRQAEEEVIHASTH